MMFKSISVFILICLSSILGNFVYSTENSVNEIEPQYIESSQHKNELIEFFYLKPEGDGPFPVMFLLHGAQFPDKTDKTLGGKQFVGYGHLEKFNNEGMIAVSISAPGYGNSTGNRDSSGPDSQKAVIDVINHFKKMPFVDTNKMGLYGISKGAILGSMVSVHSPDIALQILEGGNYDQLSRYAIMPDYLHVILDTFIKESDGSVQALIERSAIFHTDKIHAATLILQGEFDDRKGLVSAEILHKKLLEKGVNSKLTVFHNALHVLPQEKWETIIPYLREKFFNLFGIGINVAQTKPAIQIAKILPNSPAFRSGSLKIGDAILKISPNNDEREIDALNMPVHEFVKHIIGVKGSSLRFKVQHFDLTIEDIIIERG